jgi:hypothetical protein
MGDVKIPAWRKSSRSTGNGGQCVEVMAVQAEESTDQA